MAADDDSAQVDLQPATNPPAPPSVVGLGASAGGLSALRTFLSRVPPDSGLAYVVVVHLSPEHESHLPDLLQPHVQMPVLQVTQTVELKANHVYVIPPAANLSAVDSHLRLSSLEASRRERAPIDHFLRTLAATHDGHAVGVILTGTGSDGSLGIRAIKEKNGLTIAQDPAQAEYDAMPRSAIATGMVDLILPLEEIPEALLGFVGTHPKIRIPRDEDDTHVEERLLLQKLFTQLRARTGRDFSRYKQSTLLRRVRRRMQLAQLESLTTYLERLREDADEVRALADDLLITVTNFFRDPPVWERLERDIVPALFDHKAPGQPIRVWSVGCASGEEAYSLAILLLEEAARRDHVPLIQVFASDLHERSLERARDGFYPGDVATDVSAERLARFFVKDDGGYRVKKEVRELVVFAPHNLLGDPPFSRMDLITCRNVLIYLQSDAQRDVLDIFHYALLPEGYLVLGTSETIDGSAELFRVDDRTHHVWRKRNVRASETRLPMFPRAGTLSGVGDSPKGRAGAGEPMAYGALHQQLVERFAPPSMLVSADDKVVHLSEHAGRYLVHPGGELTSSALKLVREELRLELSAALHAARDKGRPTRSQPVPVKFDGEVAAVVLDVRPAPGTEHQGFSLVVFDERETVAPAASSEPGVDDDTRRLVELQTELDRTRQHMQALIEEYETTQEEMRVSQEEMQSSNEELRSTLEELETSKEELQSVNEELQTVNQENRHKVEELGQLSSDLQNLLASTDIATLFLDRSLRILRFTPRVGEIFNVRPVDRGRPLSDLTHRLGYPELQADAESVLRTLVPVEREVRDERGRWYLGRVLPYRGGDDRIEGVVLTFIDMTARRQAEEALRENEQRLGLAIEVGQFASWDWDLRTGEVTWNDRHFLMQGYGVGEVTPSFAAWLARVHADDRDETLALIENARTSRQIFAHEYRTLLPDGSVRWNAARGRFFYEGNEPYRMIGVLEDITERRLTHGALEDRVRERTSEVRSLFRRLLSVQEEERSRIARDIHDQLGQQMTALRMHLELLASRSASDHALATLVARTQTLAVELDRSVDFLTWDLRPAALEHLGLAAALEKLAGDWSERFTIDTAFEGVSTSSVRPPQEVEANLYRIAQEALHNILKHAHATRVELSLRQGMEDVVLTITDNGRGFDSTAVHEGSGSRGLGLVSMQERSALVGGRTDVTSRVGQGTTVTVRVPVAHGDAG